MPEFRRDFQVNAPLEVVAQFHRDPTALRLLTLPPIIVQIHRAEPLAEGSQVDFTLWLGPLPVRWLAEHVAVDEQAGFTDVQRRGPFKSWQHRHSFRALSDRETLVSDEIRLEFGSGLFNGLVGRLMWLGLPVLFAYRAWATRGACRKKVNR